MRIAHIIMAHKNPKQLLRLIKSLEHPNADFFIHIDKKVLKEEFKIIENLSQVKFIKNRINCNWGGNSLFLGILSSLNEVVSDNIEYDFINLLSAQDYPLTSAENIFNFLQSRPQSNFISYDESRETEWWKKAVSRYEKHHFTDLSFRGKYLLQKIVNKIFPVRKFPMEMELYGSCKSTWWTISGTCAKYVDEIFTNNKQLRNFLKYSWGTDEFAFASIVMNSSFKDSVINNNLRYIDFSQGHAHPKTLLIEDYDKIASSKMLFARKFDDQVDEYILDRIDAECLN
ncbi:beta-1,6-N-acetylglucosaminyltransferase [Pedobacter aquatilis]|uniref:beta-1,6-N-acetylglucosaminyltransferase n=1 Tax=Pedobacter aquatilis TaxID=351343 RepID=UPI0025B5B11D|nr:beta-1,6-N-acetylglucosaminyltransferase [Pedobacter aquatilis]MDN3585391.1 beta-1,6-N-acetylglucosaminyltransferase [Pedobacter aquatilis]